MAGRQYRVPASPETEPATFPLTPATSTSGPEHGPSERDKLAAIESALPESAHEALHGWLADPRAKGSLDALYGLATGSAHPSLGGAASSSLYEVVRELTSPDNAINQGNRGTCTMTNVVHDLADDHPAEYARLVHALVTTGTATLANGDKIRVPADAFSSDNSERSTSERLLQSALMEYAHPGYHSAMNPTGGKGGHSYDGFDDRREGGLTAEEVARVQQAVYARPTDVTSGTFAGHEMLERARVMLADDQHHGPVQAFLEWGDGVHVVELTKIDGDRVQFRNPIGGPEPYSGGGEDTLRVRNTGATYKDPTRRVDDAGDALESMTVSDFVDELDAIVGPR